MEFIKANLEDVESVTEIVQTTILETYAKYYPQAVVDFFLKIHSKENIAKDIQKNVQYLILEQGIFVGTGGYHENHITRLYILPEYQGKGYGSKMLAFLEKQISPKFTTAVLDPSYFAIPFYQKYGYTQKSHEVCLLKDGVTLDHDIFEKVL